MANVLVTQTSSRKSKLQFTITILSSNDPHNPTSRTPTNGTPHSPKASVNNPSNYQSPSSNSCDYTQMANISPFLILKGRVTIMDKLKVKVKNMYPQAHAYTLAIGLLACVIHQHNKDSGTTMARVKRRKTHPLVRWFQSLSTSQSLIMTIDQRLKSPEALNWCPTKNSFLH